MPKLALLIGISDYEEQTVPNLPAVMGDLEAMRQVLEDPQIAQFDRVTILRNPNRQDMADAIEQLFSFDCQPDDLILLYFSGHGVKDNNENLYLTSTNTREEQGRFSKASAIEARFIQDQMRGSRCKRQVIILDCCFSGAFAEGLPAKKALLSEPIVTTLEAQLGVPRVAPEPKMKGLIAPTPSSTAQRLGLEGRAILTSSTDSQPSFEERGSKISVYTRHLVEGLRTGAADLNGDGVILIEELHDFAKERVQEAFPDMKPEIYAIQEGYKIRLAQAKINDPELEYRKEVERSHDSGIITAIGRRMLNRRRIELGLTIEETAAIEAEVLKPYQEYRENFAEFQEALREGLTADQRLTPLAYDQLKRFQQILRLRDEDVEITLHNKVTLFLNQPQIPQNHSRQPSVVGVLWDGG
ncbi:MAG: caspase family protein [Oculatellaceae cyanobacterium Prado106]|nr:caspase family protein [Oculatellaceae cyanobacterium Prado106]